MDWKLYRRHEPENGRTGRYPENTDQPLFEFLHDQGPGRRFNCVPGRIVVPTAHEGMLSGVLAGCQAGQHVGGTTVFAVPTGSHKELLELIGRANKELGAHANRTPVAPLHALAVHDHGDFGPAGPPSEAGPLVIPAASVAEGAAEDRVRVGLLDTGVYKAHPLLEGHLDADADDEVIEFDPATGKLKLAVGHGTFVAGVVRRCAPGAVLYPRNVVTTDGVTDDVALAVALKDLGPKVDILCMSLGGYAMDDRGPQSILAILDDLFAEHPDLQIVASAGNDSRDEPVFPAADDRVIGVGALDDNGERAGYSNYGGWVDTYALGTKIHSAFVEWDAPDSASSTSELLAAEPGRQGPWATWSGTSFAAPIVAGAIASAMRPGPGVKKSARDAAFAVVRDGRLPRPTASGSRTSHSFVI